MTAVLAVGTNDNNDYEQLTPRELEVMLLYSNPYLEYNEISDKLSMSTSTLKKHINHIFDKLEETDRYTVSIKFFRLYPQHRELLDKLITNV